MFLHADWKLLLFFFFPKLILFGLNNQLVVSYKEENLMAFKNLFLKGYSGVDEDEYSISIYTKERVFDSLHHVIDQVCISISSAFSPTFFFLTIIFFPSSINYVNCCLLSSYVLFYCTLYNVDWSENDKKP